MEAKGYRVGADFSCKGWDTYGAFKLLGGIYKNRPNDNYLRLAREFAEKLKV